MLAAVIRRYGDPSFVEVVDVPRPEPGPRDLLIRVRATTVTAGDTEIRSLRMPPILAIPIRLYFGLFRPKRVRVLGMEFSGEVIAVGSEAKRFSVGDRVFGSAGFAFGGQAEYLALAEDGVLARVPDGVSDADAATLPTGAYEGLSFAQKARIQKGERVLVFGGSGSIGSFTIQTCAAAGARVSASGNPQSLETMRDLGASHVIDYTQQDFADPGTLPDGEKYDVIIDAIGKCPMVRAFGVLKRGGRYLRHNPKVLQALVGAFASIGPARTVVSGAPEISSADLDELARLVAGGDLKVVVDSRYSLDDARAAHARVDTGEKLGNVIVDVS